MTVDMNNIRFEYSQILKVAIIILAIYVQLEWRIGVRARLPKSSTCE
jgi:hypothetical protein